jgi:uncharacterized protein (TIGR03435 family)
MRAVLLLVGVVAIAVRSLAAQSFEAASIRTSGESVFGRGFIGLQPGRLLATEATVRELVGVAYGLTPERISGGPSWTSSTRYNITATTAGQVTREQAQQMLQQLLANRFSFTSHYERRQLPVYILAMARKDGSFGTQLRRSGPECQPVTPLMANGAAPPPPPPPPPGADSMRPLLERQSRLRCPTMFFPGGVSARAITLDEFTYRLSRFLSRPIIDRTDLSGEFDIDLTYQSELVAGPPGAALDAAGPSIFRAVQDQLGLKLESGRAPVEVLVIDRANPPTEN